MVPQARGSGRHHLGGCRLGSGRRRPCKRRRRRELLLLLVDPAHGRILQEVQELLHLGRAGSASGWSWASADAAPMDTKNSSAKLHRSRAGALWSACVVIIETAIPQKTPLCEPAQGRCTGPPSAPHRPGSRNKPQHHTGLCIQVGKGHDDQVGPLGVVADLLTKGCGIRCEIPHQARPVTAAARPIQSEFDVGMARRQAPWAAEWRISPTPRRLPALAALLRR